MLAEPCNTALVPLIKNFLLITIIVAAKTHSMIAKTYGIFTNSPIGHESMNPIDK